MRPGPFFEGRGDLGSRARMSYDMTVGAPCVVQRKRSAFRWRALAAGLLLALAIAGPSGSEDLKKSGTVRIEQVQIAFIGSGNLGGGTLQFGGKSYDFTIGGLGIGGIGISKITATGGVYNLNNASDFEGTYGQARYGLAVGSASTGELWLKNSRGVYLQLKAERQGLALSLGGDAVYVKFE